MKRKYVIYKDFLEHRFEVIEEFMIGSLGICFVAIPRSLLTMTESTFTYEMLNSSDQQRVRVHCNTFGLNSPDEFIYASIFKRDLIEVTLNELEEIVYELEGEIRCM